MPEPAITKTQGRAGLREGDVLGRWTLTEYVKTGGNGDVWFVQTALGEEGAIKVLHRLRDEDYERFLREVGTCKEIADLTSILPIIDDHLPAKPSKQNRAWFVMPRAEPLSSALAGAGLVPKVEAVAEATTTLALAAELRGLHHRDIKPDNLFKYAGKVAVGDWGLVKGSGDPDLTNPEHPVGPIHGLAPELAVGDPEPDFEKVDVYYLAMTLWQLALERPVPPRGHVRSDQADSLTLRMPDEPGATQLATLIDQATQRDPRARPTLRAFGARLAEWIANEARAEDQRTDHERYATKYEEREARSRAVLQWVITKVRSEPIFNALVYHVPSDLDASVSDVPGLTERQMAEALGDLIDTGLLFGQPEHVLGRPEPRYFTHIYPTVSGLDEVLDVDELVRSAAPLLRALVEPVDVLSLPRSSDPMEILPGLVMTPPEAYFELCLLSDVGLLDYERLPESGGSATLTGLRATSRGRRWLYEAGT